MACTYFRVLFLACDGRRQGDPNGFFQSDTVDGPWKEAWQEQMNQWVEKLLNIYVISIIDSSIDGSQYS